MPLTTAKFECKDCGDLFIATSEDWSKCKCGNSEVKAGQYTYPYRGKGSHKLIESNTYYFEEDFLILDDHLNKLYLKIKGLCKDLGFHVHEMTEKGKDGEKFLDVISISKTDFQSSYRSEQNEVQLHCKLGKTYSSPKYENIESRFNQFISFLEKVKSGEIELKNRDQLLKYSDENDIYWSRQQIEEYDYHFSF